MCFSRQGVFSNTPLRVGLILGGSLAMLLLLIWAGNLFATLRLRLQDVYFIPAPVSGQVTIVALDDASMEAYGRTPAEWSRTVFADLLQALGAAGARVIAFDVLFAEATPDDADLLAALEAVRSAEARTRIIMPLVGLERANAETGQIGFATALQPLAAIRDRTDYLGVANTAPDVDGVVRRHPSLIVVEDQTYPVFSLAAYLAYLRIPSAALPQVVTTQEGAVSIAGQHTFSVDSLGFWRSNFFGAASTDGGGIFPVVSARDVLEGRADAAAFADRIVLVGLMNSAGVTDQYPTPLAQRMAGVELHANAIESLLQSTAITEQSRPSEAITFVALTLLASLLYVRLRWYWMLAAGLVFLLGWYIFAFLWFGSRQEMLSLFYPTLALGLPALAALGIQITTEFNQRRRAEFLLESVVEVSKKRLELSAVLAHLAADVRRILEAEQVTVWLHDADETPPLQAVYTLPFQAMTTPDSGLPLAETAYHTGQQAQAGQALALPFIWQGQVLAVLSARLNARQRIRPASLKLLQTLAERIAPGLENATLHAQTHRQKMLVEAVLAGSPAGIIILDDHLRVKQGNFSTDKAMILASAAYVGQPLTALLTDSGTPDAFQSKLLAALTGGKGFREELKHHGKTYMVDAALLRKSGEWVLMFTDISSVAELSELKTRMIRMASHDLKNPLSGVLGYSSLILMDEVSTGLSAQHREFIEHIQHAGEAMLQIINDILNLEQMRSRQLQQEPVQLGNLLEEVIGHHLLDMKTKGQTFNDQRPPELPTILGDKRQLAQAFTNLVGNAVKYTPEGGQITLRSVQQDGIIRFEVQDTGYGIAKAAQEKLFQEFYRVRSEATAHISGTGLGLSLVKSIIEAHQGKIWVESAEGVGSTFFVELPIPTQPKT